LEKIDEAILGRESEKRVLCRRAQIGIDEQRPLAELRKGHGQVRREHAATVSLPGFDHREHAVAAPEPAQYQFAAQGP